MLPSIISTGIYCHFRPMYTPWRSRDTINEGYHHISASYLSPEPTSYSLHPLLIIGDLTRRPLLIIQNPTRQRPKERDLASIKSIRYNTVSSSLQPRIHTRNRTHHPYKPSKLDIQSSPHPPPTAPSSKNLTTQTQGAQQTSH